MKVLALLTVAATLASEGLAHRQHNAAHNHVKRHGHGHGGRQVKREPSTATEYVPGPVATVYELEGVVITEEEAEEGLNDGRYSVTGETEPEMPEIPEPEEEEEEEPEYGAQFFEQPETTPTPSSEPTPTPTPEEVVEEDVGSGNLEGQGLDSEFPSGEIDCSTFPASYGPVPIDYLGMGGWIGLQHCPNFTPGSLISFIETGITGGGCTSSSFCSYACPVGYQKTQWPSEQGATLQSIGGLFCNAQGKLELSNPDKPTLCEPGVGGVTIQNDMSEQVSTCRTDYPGTESMTIPTIAQGGQSGIPLTNPDQNYYIWNGAPTSAQYYVNKKGRAVEKACLWDSDEEHDASGNWAPVIIGTGKAADGNTYISIFPNLPTSTAPLDFNIEILGGNTECKLENGQYTGNPMGCTTAFTEGGSVVIRFYD